MHMADSVNALKAKWVPNGEKLLRCSKKKAAWCYRMDRKDTQTEKTRTMLPAVTQRVQAHTHLGKKRTEMHLSWRGYKQQTQPLKSGFKLNGMNTEKTIWQGFCFVLFCSQNIILQSIFMYLFKKIEYGPLKT